MGLAWEAEGDASLNPAAEHAAYNEAAAQYKQGMHFATGSGEGWFFRDQYDRPWPWPTHPEGPCAPPTLSR